MVDYRIGHGYDVHKLVEGRRLVIGGVEIPHTLGLLGHSDADVLVHAIMDAIIGALGLGDIGKHFPDNSAEFKNISSLKLLESVKKLMDDKNAEKASGESKYIEWLYSKETRGYKLRDGYVVVIDEPGAILVPR
jgi:2-C-methyl-D-erythritol 2,4-cyclodiphosphate synthase